MLVIFTASFIFSSCGKNLHKICTFLAELIHFPKANPSFWIKYYFFSIFFLEQYQKCVLFSDW